MPANIEQRKRPNSAGCQRKLHHPDPARHFVGVARLFRLQTYGLVGVQLHQYQRFGLNITVVKSVPHFAIEKASHY
jgi:hypothetical protein